MIPRLWLAGGALALLASTHTFVGYRAYQMGKSSEAAKHRLAVEKLENDLKGVTDRATDAERERLALERQRNDLLTELDAEGDADAGADRISLPAGSVSRIDAVGR